MQLHDIKSISVICLGNICRSPMGEVILRDRFNKHELDIEVCSGGTGDWHIGENANRKTIQVLEENGYVIRHSARQITREWFNSHDLFMAMDLNNYRDLQKLGGAKNFSKIKMFREFDAYPRILFDTNKELDVPDPYYGSLDDFTRTLRLVEVAADNFVGHILKAREE